RPPSSPSLLATKPSHARPPPSLPVAQLPPRAIRKCLMVVVEDARGGSRGLPCAARDVAGQRPGDALSRAALAGPRRSCDVRCSVVTDHLRDRSGGWRYRERGGRSGLRRYSCQVRTNAQSSMSASACTRPVRGSNRESLAEATCANKGKLSEERFVGRTGGCRL